MLLGFKKRFVPKIQNGSKIHTLRTERKVAPKIGEALHMYTGLRTKSCELICNTERLIGMQKASVNILTLNKYIAAVTDCAFGINVCVDGRQIQDKELADFIVNDGFDSAVDFAEYWLNGEKRIKWDGYIFHWTDLKY